MMSLFYAMFYNPSLSSGNVNTLEPDAYYALEKEITTRIAPPKRIDMKDGYAFVFFSTTDEANLAVQQLKYVLHIFSVLFI